MEGLKASIFIATPMYGGMCTGAYTMGLVQSTQVFANNRILMYFGFTQNESLITRARNRMAHDFLSTECTHLMFIDADIGFNAEDIIPMIEADKEIVCGIYPKKEIDWPRVKEAVEHGVPAEQLDQHTGAFVLNLIGGARAADVRLNQPFEIENGGTGFMLIKREVFEKLADKVPSYSNDMHTAVQSELGVERETIKEYFATSICEESNNRLLSEDYHFCKLARKNGIKIWGAPWAMLSHTGTYTFQGNLIRNYGG